MPSARADRRAQHAGGGKRPTRCRSKHYDVPINYVGHAEKWDEIAVDGDIAGKDCLLRYKLGGRVLAVASIYRDVASLEAELVMERETA